jgi:hypothetical protein
MDSRDKLIEELRAIIADQAAQLKKQATRIEQLELELAKAKKDSSTSSKPPSSDLIKPKPKPKRPGPRKKPRKGGQPGHQRQLREPLPPERVDETIIQEIDSDEVKRLGLRPTGNFDKIQHIELPDSPVRVTELWLTEYQDTEGNLYIPDCPELRGPIFGPRMLAMIGWLKSVGHCSYSTVENWMEDVLQVPVSRGYLAKLCTGTISSSLAEPYDELEDAIPRQDQLGSDETSFKDNGKKHWIWCITAATFSVFHIAPLVRGLCWRSWWGRVLWLSELRLLLGQLLVRLELLDQSPVLLGSFDPRHSVSERETSGQENQGLGRTAPGSVAAAVFGLAPPRRDDGRRLPSFDAHAPRPLSRVGSQSSFHEGGRESRCAVRDRELLRWRIAETFKNMTCRRTTFASCLAMVSSQQTITANSKSAIALSIAASPKVRVAKLASDTMNECGQRSPPARSRNAASSHFYSNRSPLNSTGRTHQASLSLKLVNGYQKAKQRKRFHVNVILRDRTYCDLTWCPQRVRSGVELSGEGKEGWSAMHFLTRLPEVTVRITESDRRFHALSA